MPARVPEPSRPTSDLTALIRANQAWVWRYLSFLGCDAALADDLVQDTFVAVLGTGESVSPRALRSYLRRVAYSLFLKARKRQRRSRELIDPEIAEVAFDLFSGDDDGSSYLDALRVCLATLDQRSRRAIEWRYAENLSRVEIGQRLELSEGGTKSLLSRSYARLRACVRRRIDQ